MTTIKQEPDCAAKLEKMAREFTNVKVQVKEEIMVLVRLILNLN